jgi:predicted nucleotidyltransferase
MLGDPGRELSLTEILNLTGEPHPSVSREVQRAELAGLVASRRDRHRPARASRHCQRLLRRASRRTDTSIRCPVVLADALRGVEGLDEAYVYGSWAARHSGEPGRWPVGDIDVLVLGEPDRDRLYEAVSAAEQRLGRPVQATVVSRAGSTPGLAPSTRPSPAGRCSGSRPALIS